MTLSLQHYFSERVVVDCSWLLLRICAFVLSTGADASRRALGCIGANHCAALQWPNGRLHHDCQVGGRRGFLPWVLAGDPARGSGELGRTHHVRHGQKVPGGAHGRHYSVPRVRRGVLGLRGQFVLDPRGRSQVAHHGPSAAARRDFAVPRHARLLAQGKRNPPPREMEHQCCRVIIFWGRYI